jgi:RNA polymerase sigma-70 factor, ECF subfamily
MTACSLSPVAEPASSTVDLDAQARPATVSELRSRFQSDVIPLLEPLYRHAMRIARNNAEDLLQDTMMKAYAGLQSFEQDTNLHGWLFRIMTNAHINTYRKRQRRPAEYPIGHLTEALLATAAHHSPTGQRSAEEHALDRLGDNQIRAAMQALPERLRLAIYYADVEGLPCKEIADLMHTPLSTVTSRLHRGRRLLQGLLADVAQQHGCTAAVQPA